MSKRKNSSRAQAEHCRELAQWTDDERAQNILMEMARELERQDAADAPAEAPRPLPRPLS